VPSVAQRYGWKIGAPRLVESELRLNLYKFRDMQPPFTIFLGSTIDMFADAILSSWISRVLEHCRRYPDNTYLFQSKNPKRFSEFNGQFPTNVIFGTTIESDYLSPSKAPKPRERAAEMQKISGMKMVSIEPVMDFDLDVLVDWLIDIEPNFVSIGADSKGHGLPEPPKEKVVELVKKLNDFTEVRVKSNIKRIFKH
jgi:protein gp37